MLLTGCKYNKKGISIVELLIVIAVVITALGGLFALVTFAFQFSTLIRENAQANNLAQETLEAVRNFRDGTDWDTNGLGVLATSTAYYPNKSGDLPPKWQLILGAETVDQFIRKVIFYDVYRDANDNIIETGGTLDPDTRKIIATISWKDEEVKVATYLTNWR